MISLVKIFQNPPIRWFWLFNNLALNWLSQENHSHSEWDNPHSDKYSWDSQYLWFQRFLAKLAFFSEFILQMSATFLSPKSVIQTIDVIILKVCYSISLKLKINLTVKAFWDSKIQVFDGEWNINENTFVLVRREEVVFFILELLFHFLVFSSINLEVQVNLTKQGPPKTEQQVFDCSGC